MAALAVARTGAAIAYGLVEGQAAKTDSALIALRNTAWGILGRPRHSGEMDFVFPGGTQALREAPPEKKPTLLRQLAGRFRAVKSEWWTPEMCEGWAAEVDGLRASLEAALAAYQPSADAEALAETSDRAAILNLYAKLAAFKRDLRSIGLSNAQIHEIIPDGTAINGVRKKVTGTGTTPGSGSPAPGTEGPPPANQGAGGGGAGGAPV